MKNGQWVIPALLLLAGLAAGFAAGLNTGFATGSEWSLMQADILAREAGVSMPVSYDGNTFRVVIKQPKGLYRRASRLADREEATGKPYEPVNITKADRNKSSPVNDAEL